VPGALSELQRTADEFDLAQRTLEEALREWARALRSANPNRLVLAAAEAH